MFCEAPTKGTFASRSRTERKWGGVGGGVVKKDGGLKQLGIYIVQCTHYHLLIFHIFRKQPHLPAFVEAKAVGKKIKNTFFISAVSSIFLALIKNLVLSDQTSQFVAPSYFLKFLKMCKC